MSMDQKMTPLNESPLGKNSLYLIEDLLFRYGGTFEFKMEALSLKAGYSYVIVGPSGSGKTTFIKILAGLLPLNHGKIFFDGKILHGPNNKIAFVSQKNNLLPWKSVRDNLYLGIDIESIEREKIQIKTDSILKELEIDQLLDRYPFQISYGQQQRVAIARSLLMDPKVLLMDEPFSSLDPDLRMITYNLLGRLKKEFDLTIILSTHQMEEALLLGEEIILFPTLENQEFDILKNPKAWKNTTFDRYSALNRDQIKEIIRLNLADHPPNTIN